MNNYRIDDEHLLEWVNGSGVDPEIVKLNVRSLIPPATYDFLLYSDQLKRRNDGRLNGNTLKAYQHLDDRGWGVNAIDPETGELIVDSIGGKYLATSSVEYAYQVADNWRVAAFVDAGSATNDTSTTLTYSVGPGVHWLSPIGPVRLYVARGFAPDENTWQLHILLGPEL